MTDMRALIKAELDRCDHLTFVELSRIPGFHGTKEILAPESFGNTIIWQAMSQEFCDAINGLIVDGEAHLYPSTPLVYMFDGCILKLPIAKTKRVYKTPHWLPCVLNRGGR